VTCTVTVRLLVRRSNASEPDVAAKSPGGVAVPFAVAKLTLADPFSEPDA